MSNLDFMGSVDIKAKAQEASNIDMPIPAGKYTATITEADIEKSKSGEATMIKLRLDVTGPKHAGRVVFDRIIVHHTNPSKQKSAEIGVETFAVLAVSTGFDTRPNDTKLLIGKSVGIKVKIERSEEYGDRNNVSYYFTPSGVTAPVAAPQNSGEFKDDDVPF